MKFSDETITALLSAVEVISCPFIHQGDEKEDDDDMLFFILIHYLSEQQPGRQKCHTSPSPRRAKHRVSWPQFMQMQSDHHFRRMFRMPKEDFQLLCDTICSNIGSQTFLPVSFIPNNTSQTQHCNKKVGGIIPGEMKVAIAIRMLAGASYLDLVPLFNVMTSYVFQIFEDVLPWILRTFEFPLVRWLREGNWKALETLAADFAEKTAGVYYGPFGALNGLALRIKSPSGVADPGNYWCRKGFYALNVQAIGDRCKRFLWCNPSHKGSTHDSQAFDSSKLYELLTEMADELEERGLFIVADSAYALSPFMQVPYDANNIQKMHTIFIFPHVEYILSVHLVN